MDSVTMALNVLTSSAAQIMHTRPKTLPLDADVAAVRDRLRDTHVHLLLLTDRRGVLRGTIERDDVAPAVPGSAAARAFASLEGRVVGPQTPMTEVDARLVATGRRRMAVVDTDGRLLGLLCRKRSGTGYCSDENIEARAADPRVDTSPC